MLLRLLQNGEYLGMPHSRPMPRIGSGCHELRLYDGGVAWRIVYALESDVILILAVFIKKTRETPDSIIDICRRRLAEYRRTGATKMKVAKVKRLAKAGWRVGSAGDFLGLSPEEAALVEMRLALSKKLRECRVDAGLSQTQLAARMGSSQSRIAKMEAADPTVSLELLIRSLLALGTSTKDIARALAI